MKVQRTPALEVIKERTANGLQLTRVVPPNFSVPFEGVNSPAFFIAEKTPISLESGARALQERKRRKKNGKERKISQKYHIT